MKIALFGGTFDPVHKGHVNAALEVIRQGIVDQVWFIPVQWHAFKQNLNVTSLKHRKSMIELAIEGHVSLKEIDFKESPTYTIDTILEAKKRFSGNTFFWLMGTNLIEEFSSWKQPEKVLQELKLILFPVPGSEGEKSKLVDSSSPIRVKDNAIDLSSTVVRQKLQKGETVKGLVDKKVLNYIGKNSLYSQK